jgi:uncharacterized RDD family membrane protein YckC
MVNMEDYLNLGQKKKKFVAIASPWKRSLAFIIDYLILNSFVLFPFNNLIGKFYSASNLKEMIGLFTNHNTNIKPLIYISTAMTIITVMYFVLLELKYNQTIGKMLMNIYVVDGIDQKVKTSHIKIGQSIARNISVVFLYFLPPIWLLDAVYVYMNKEGQRFCEKLSRTKTVEIAII